MAGNRSTQSLSDSINRPIIDNGSETCPPRISSSTTVNNFVILRQQQQSTPSTLVLRAENAHSMAQWAETISRCLGATDCQLLPRHRPCCLLMQDSDDLVWHR